MTEVRPRTELEALITLAASGTTAPDVLLRALQTAEIVVLVPARDEAPDATALQPLIVSNGTNSFLAMFTHVDRVPPQFGTGHSAVAVPASLILRGISNEAGLVVNPGTAEGFDVPAAGLAAFLAAHNLERYFVRQQVKNGALVPFALLRRTADGDQVLKDVDDWRPDANGSVDRAIRFSIDSDLDEITPAQAEEFQSMVAQRRYWPLTPSR